MTETKIDAEQEGVISYTLVPNTGFKCLEPTMRLRILKTQFNTVNSANGFIPEKLQQEWRDRFTGNSEWVDVEVVTINN